MAANAASSARVRSPGDSDDDGRSTASAPSPNLASCGRAPARGESPVAAMNASARLRRLPQDAAVLGQLADDDARAHPPRPRRQREAAEQRLDERRLARPVGADERRRGPPSAMSSVRGPSVKSPRSITASSRRTTTSPERAASLMLKRRSQPSQGFSTSSSDSSARSVRRARAASRSVRLMRKSRCALSLSRGRFFSRATPVVAHWRSRWARRRSSARWVS